MSLVRSLVFLLFPTKISSDLPASETAGNCTLEPCSLSFSSFKSNLLRRVCWRLWRESLWNRESSLNIAVHLYGGVFLFFFLTPMVVLVCPANIQFSFLMLPPLLWAEEKEVTRNKAFWGLLLHLSAQPWSEQAIILERFYSSFIDQGFSLCFFVSFLFCLNFKAEIVLSYSSTSPLVFLFCFSFHISLLSSLFVVISLCFILLQKMIVLGTVLSALQYFPCGGDICGFDLFRLVLLLTLSGIVPVVCGQEGTVWCRFLLRKLQVKNIRGRGVTFL